MRRQLLCTTLAGNSCELLTVAHRPDLVDVTAGDGGDEDSEERQCIVVTARVHPGEAQASWMMEGFVDFLTSTAPEAAALRQRFVFVVVPMLNPDGVVLGNSRCFDVSSPLAATSTFPTSSTLRLACAELLAGITEGSCSSATSSTAITAKWSET